MRRSLLRLAWEPSPSLKLRRDPVPATLSRYNNNILRSAEQGNLVHALSLAKALKNNISPDLKPNVYTYEALAKAFAVHGMHEESMRLIEDAKAAGIEPDVGVWNQVLRAHVIGDASTSPVLDAMMADNISPNTFTRHLIIQRLANERNLEGALKYLCSLEDPKATSSQTSVAASIPFRLVSLQTVVVVIELAAGTGETKLAADLILKYEQESSRRFPERVFLRLANESVNEDDLESATLACKRLSSMNVDVDEGLATSLLNLFSRHGQVEQCEELIERQLSRILQGAKPKEWHIAPLVTVYTMVGRVRDAILAFNELEVVVPTRANNFMKPSYRIFVAGLRTEESITSALSSLDEIVADNTASPRLSIPIQFLNALIKACDDNHLTEAFAKISEGMLKGRDGPYGSAPDIESFNLVLRHYRVRRSRSSPDNQPEAGGFDKIEEVERLLHILKTTYPKLKPDQNTYETLISLYLSSDESDIWPVAFQYLEEMKHFDILPSSQIYVAFLNRLLRPTNSTLIAGSYERPAVTDHRLDLLLQEMAAIGYLGGSGSGLGHSARSILTREMKEKIGEDRIRSAVRGLFQNETDRPQRQRRQPHSR